jgi:hypothetical protein
VCCAVLFGWSPPLSIHKHHNRPRPLNRFCVHNGTTKINELKEKIIKEVKKKFIV